MYTKNKNARDWLDDASRTEFDGFVEEAMLSDFERAVCYARKNKKSNVAISLDLHCGVSTVDRAVTKIYCMVNKIVF